MLLSSCAAPSVTHGKEGSCSLTVQTTTKLWWHEKTMKRMDIVFVKKSLIPEWTERELWNDRGRVSCKDKWEISNNRRIYWSQQTPWIKIFCYCQYSLISRFFFYLSSQICFSHCKYCKQQNTQTASCSYSTVVKINKICFFKNWIWIYSMRKCILINSFLVFFLLLGPLPKPPDRRSDCGGKL